MMKKLLLSFAVAMVVTLLPSSAAGQSDNSNVAPLNNKDILLMVDRKVEPEAIVRIIKSSACTFDTFPPLLLEMKRRGVPESVLEAMLDAPYGPSAQNNTRDDLGEEPIFHYIEHLKQLGYVNALATGRRATPSRRTRASRSRILR